ncbi:MAG: T9SS type A sorting domain-containing protein, partial [Crocinitomicaceae bacterium]
KDIEFCLSNNDGDLLGDHIDIDDDNDGIPDLIETGGVDPLADADGDGVAAYLDDNDNDPTVFNNNGNVETAFDFDADNVANHFDLDSDNDGIADIIEAGGFDINGDGQADYPITGNPESMTDADNDGLSDTYDSSIPASALIEIEVDLDAFEDETTWTLQDPFGSVIGSGGPYANGDDIITFSITVVQSGIYTFTIFDSFGDGIDFNNGSDENGASGYSVDVNGGTVFTSAPSPAFGLFDAVPFNVTISAGTPGFDIPLFNTDNTSGADYLDLDSDNDGIGDNIELNLGDITDDLGGGAVLDGMVGNGGIVDVNGNGWSDADEGTDARPDSDADELFDMLDVDSDNDGIREIFEGPCTFCPSFGMTAQIDSDGDGFSDQYENLTAANFGGGSNQGINPNDHEGDNTPDYLDLDTDNDGGFDWTEGYDVNGDGITAPEFEQTAIDYALAGGSPLDYPVTNSDTDIVPDFADNQPLTFSYVESIRPPFFSTAAGFWLDVDEDGLVDLMDEDIAGSAFGQYAPLPNTDGIGDRDWRDIATIVILPVELLSFTATPYEREVVLDWETATEKDVDYFILERSDNAQDWEEIAEVNAVGNSQSLLAYSWTDEEPLNGVSYYRLKIVDIDFNTEYSHIEVINRASKGEILVYPNPATDVVTIKADFDGESQVDILSTTGAVVRSIPVSGAKIVTFDISSLADGCYYFSFFLNNGERITEKLVINAS